jgi:hypothetical protein
VKSSGVSDFHDITLSTQRESFHGHIDIIFGVLEKHVGERGEICVIREDVVRALKFFELN